MFLHKNSPNAKIESSKKYSITKIAFERSSSLHHASSQLNIVGYLQLASYN